MKLKNTEHLINSYLLTVICVKDDDNILLYKLLSVLDETVTSLNETVASNGANNELQNDKFASYSRQANELIEFAELNDTHLLATVLLDKPSDWRSIYFKIAEKHKDEVCFVRFITNEDNSDIRLQIESGENAWQYIQYRLDKDGHIAEMC